MTVSQTNASLLLPRLNEYRPEYTNTAPVGNGFGVSSLRNLVGGPPDAPRKPAGTPPQPAAAQVQPKAQTVDSKSSPWVAAGRALAAGQNRTDPMAKALGTLLDLATRSGLQGLGVQNLTNHKQVVDLVHRLVRTDKDGQTMAALKTLASEQGLNFGVGELVEVATAARAQNPALSTLGDALFTEFKAHSASAKPPEQPAAQVPLPFALRPTALPLDMDASGDE